MAAWKILLLAQIEFLMRYSEKLDLPTLAESKIYPESTEFKTTISSRLNGRTILSDSSTKNFGSKTIGLFGPGKPEFDKELADERNCKADMRKIWGFSPEANKWYLGEVRAISNSPDDKECHQIVSFALDDSTIDEVIANIHPMVIIEKIRSLVQNIWHQLKTDLADFELRVLTPVSGLWSKAESWKPYTETALVNVLIPMGQLDTGSVAASILNGSVKIWWMTDEHINLDAELREGESICRGCGRIYTGKECCKE